jgi:hypothetical protein
MQVAARVGKAMRDGKNAGQERSQLGLRNRTLITHLGIAAWDFRSCGATGSDGVLPHLEA